MKLLAVFFFFFFFFFAMASVFASAVAQDDGQQIKQLSYTEFRKLLDERTFESASVTNDGTWVNLKSNDGSRYYMPVTPQTPIADYLYDAGVFVRIEPPYDEGDETPLWLEIFYNLLPLLIFIFFFIFILWFSQKRGKKTQDECLDRARAINDEFLEKQKAQFDKFIEQFSSAMKDKNNG